MTQEQFREDMHKEQVAILNNVGDKTAKIKAEVERIRKEMVNKGKLAEHDSEMIRLATINTCQNILCYIESLE